MSFRKDEINIGLFQFVAIAIAIHGLLYAFFGYILSYTHDVPDIIDQVYNLTFTTPAHLLTYPLEGVLWKFGLIEGDPSAWPDIWGMLLVYTIWVVFLLALHGMSGLIASLRR